MENSNECCYELSHHDNFNQIECNSTDEENTMMTMMIMGSKYKYHRHSHMQKIANIVAFLVFSFVIIMTPILSHYAVKDYGVRKDVALFYSAACFTLISIIISTREIYMHLTNWYLPRVQRLILVILLMVPVYAVVSWLSLRFHEYVVYFVMILSVYESCVIVAFVYLLMELLGDQKALISTLSTKDPSYGVHKRCFGLCLKPWVMGKDFLLQCKRGVLQYVFFEILSALCVIIALPYGNYDEFHFGWNNVYTYVRIAHVSSLIYALYSLFKFFHAVQYELSYPKNWHPIKKFVCFKAIIFFTLIQQLVIKALTIRGIIKEIGPWDAKHVASALQSYIICVEMVIFAIAHTFAYTYKECIP